MAKLDLKRVRKAMFTAPRDRFVAIEAPPAVYLMVDGHGDPNVEPAYREAVESLYSTAYAIKFARKAEGCDFVVPPLEGLWSAPDPESFVARRKAEWDWTMMIMLPDDVEDATVRDATAQIERRRGLLSDTLRREVLAEGLCLQALHVGSYDDEGPLLSHLHGTIMPEAGYAFNGHHHEVYLSDPRKTPGDRLRTVIRQPVKTL